jgi:hypothetical protein
LRYQIPGPFFTVNTFIMGQPITTTLSHNGLRSLILVIILTGLIVGTVDAILAILHFTLIAGGKHPGTIFKYIASAVYGRTAFGGGAGMIGMGILFHYCIAFTFTILFFLIYPRLPLLSRNRWVTAILYALLVWSIMNLIVVPNTNAPKQPFHLSDAVIEASILVFSVGLPVSFMAYRYYGGDVRRA